MRDSQYVMIMNVGRTGSTWLVGVLERHPEILNANETNFFATTDAEACGPGRYSVYHIVQAWMNRDSGVAAVPFQFLDEASFIQVVHDHIVDICSRALVASGRKVLVSKSPAHTLSVESQRLAYLVLPGATRIHLVRDFRAVWLSYKDRFPTYWVVERGVEAFCDIIEATYVSLDEMMGIVDFPTFRYEDLKSDPSRFRDLLAIIGVDSSDRMVGALSEYVRDNIKVGRFDSWKSSGDPDIEVVTSRLGGLLVRYGYEA